MKLQDSLETLKNSEQLKNSFFSEDFLTEIIIAVSVSIIIGIIAFFRKKITELLKSLFNDKDNIQKVEINVNLGSEKKSLENERSGGKKIDVTSSEKSSTIEEQNNFDDSRMKIDSMKNRVKILFIDDDTKFNVVKILKSDGWKHTEAVEDIDGLDIPIVRDSDIFFVDINGVGKALNCEYQGLDIAQMLKEKNPKKLVVLYSANKDQYAFHPAWELSDKRLEKNALPNQFEKIIEDFSINTYK